MNALKALQQYGQSIWLDYLRRDLLAGGGLARLIAEDGLRGRPRWRCFARRRSTSSRRTGW
jgi:hypothetical protein